MCHWRHFRWATVALVAMSACSALRPVAPPAATSVVSLTALVALGPVSGWWIASSRDEFESALPMLLTFTLLPLAAVVPWIRDCRHSGWLGLATLLWFAAGWYCVVGAWM